GRRRPLRRLGRPPLSEPGALPGDLARHAVPRHLDRGLRGLPPSRAAARSGGRFGTAGGADGLRAAAAHGQPEPQLPAEPRLGVERGPGGEASEGRTPQRARGLWTGPQRLESKNPNPIRFSGPESPKPWENRYLEAVQNAVPVA